MSAAAAGRKRRMVAPGRAARPIDKELKAVLQTATTAVVSTVLKTTTFPGTVVGLRWNLSATSIIATSDSSVYWAIVVVPDGEAANTPAVSDGADFYTPEQNVLAFGMGSVADTDVGSGPRSFIADGTTKTMRKLKQGDQLVFISLSSVAVSAQVRGVVQFFFKT